MRPKWIKHFPCQAKQLCSLLQSITNKRHRVHQTFFWREGGGDPEWNSLIYPWGALAWWFASSSLFWTVHANPLKVKQTIQLFAPRFEIVITQDVGFCAQGEGIYIVEGSKCSRQAILCKNRYEHVLLLCTSGFVYCDILKTLSLFHKPNELISS